MALLRPVVESKYQKDLDRVGTILAKFSENQIMELDGCVYSARRIPGSILQPFDEIEHKCEGGWQEVKFLGPLRKVLEQEIFCMVTEYREFRQFVQVPEWEPKENNDQYDWLFNKQAFPEVHATRAKYVEHLEQTTDSALQLKKRYQRIQALTDLHFIEAVLYRYYVPKLFKSRGLECSKTNETPMIVAK